MSSNLKVNPVTRSELYSVTRVLPPKTDYSIVSASNARCPQCLLRASSPSCLNGPPTMIFILTSGDQTLSLRDIEGLDSNRYPDKQCWIERFAAACSHTKPKPTGFRLALPPQAKKPTPTAPSAQRTPSMASNMTSNSLFSGGSITPSTPGQHFEPYATALSRRSSNGSQHASEPRTLRRSSTISDAVLPERRSQSRQPLSPIRERTFTQYSGSRSGTPHCEGGQTPRPSGNLPTASMATNAYPNLEEYLMGGPLPTTPTEFDFAGAGFEVYTGVDLWSPGVRFIDDMFAAYQRSQALAAATPPSYPELRHPRPQLHRYDTVDRLLNMVPPTPTTPTTPRPASQEEMDDFTAFMKESLANLGPLPSQEEMQEWLRFMEPGTLSRQSSRAGSRAPSAAPSNHTLRRSSSVAAPISLSRSASATQPAPSPTSPNFARRISIANASSVRRGSLLSQSYVPHVG